MNIWKNKDSNYKYFLSIIFFLNIIYFFYGFISQHDFSNGGKIDFVHIYKNFLLFKNNPITEINWSDYESSSLPLHYLITKYIIPEGNIFIFKSYTFVISLICIVPLYFIFVLKSNISNFNIIFLFLSSLILLVARFVQTLFLD